MPTIDAAFTALPFKELGAAALERARALGASYADFRFERHKGQTISARDRALQSLTNSETMGYGVRVIHDGAWGFASSIESTPDAAAATAARAVEVAKALGALNREPVELADEPVHTGTHVSRYEIDPFAVPDGDKVAWLLGNNEKILGSGKVSHIDNSLAQVLENKYLVATSGTETVQQRVRLQSNFRGVRIDERSGRFETMRSNSMPVGRGWEYCAGGYPYDREADELPDLLEEKLDAKSVEPGRYDLVLDPTNLWLTIHESIGHSTELDRALGYEANYAGTSFATLDKLNTFRVGSPAMNVTGDRVVEHGLSTVGWDDEGVAAQSWDIIREGVLVGYQLNRQMALKLGFGRSNGCAFADAPGHVPLQRMPNVSLKPGTKELTLDDLIGGVERGIYIVGDNSWSIDMQRYNFQFTGQKFFEIRGGKIVGQLRDVAYQSSTPEFWGSLEAVGGPSTYVLGGAFNCGKGQPGQIAPVTHGCPVSLFRNINVLNTSKEGA